MGSIYLARVAEGPGAGRLVVIKSLLLEHLGNSEYLKMFKAEIGFMLSLNQRNIVTLYDVDENEGCPYLVLEWVEGRNLRQIKSESNERAKNLPPDVVFAIAAEAAQGLHYAHSFVDKVSGEPRPVVHRDISLSNILVGFDGSVKIIDFGIAKALSEGQTAAGAVMGKPGYLSPEQANGEALDHRTDIFSLGIVLWELLTGRQLFRGLTPAQTVARIVDPSFEILPPSAFVPIILREMDQVVMKALERDRNLRYETALEFAQALNRSIRDFSPLFERTDIADLVKNLFGPQAEKEREELRGLIHECSLREEDRTTTLTNIPAGELKPASPPKLIPASPVALEAAQPIVRASSSKTAWIRFSEEFNRFERKSYHVRLVVGLLVLFAAFRLYSTNRVANETQDRSPAAVSASASVAPQRVVGMHLRTVPTSANMRVQVGPAVLAQGETRFYVPLDTSVEVTVDSPGFEQFSKTVFVSSEAALSEDLTLVTAVLEPIHRAFITIRTDISAVATISGNGLTLSLDTPVVDAALPEGEYTVQLSNLTFQKEKTLRVSLTRNQRTTVDEKFVGLR